MTDATLVYDFGPRVGAGHRRRVDSLANALVMRGFEISLSASGDAHRAGVLVVDSYATRADDSKLYRADRVVAVDDLGRDLSVDLVVDPAPGADGTEHRRARYVLAGAGFAIVDLGLFDMSPATVTDDCGRILVALGGTDTQGYGATIAAAIACALPDAEVRLATGRWGDQSIPAGVNAADTTDGLADELAAADVVVTAGDVTLLESLALGRPTVALSLADDQRGYVDGVAGAEAAIAVALEDAADTAISLADDPARRRALGAAGRSLVDGLGAARIADETVRLMSILV